MNYYKLQDIYPPLVKGDKVYVKLDDGEMLLNIVVNSRGRLMALGPDFAQTVEWSSVARYRRAEDMEPVDMGDFL